MHGHRNLKFNKECLSDETFTTLLQDRNDTVSEDDYKGK